MHHILKTVEHGFDFLENISNLKGCGNFVTITLWLTFALVIFNA